MMPHGVHDRIHGTAAIHTSTITEGIVYIV